MRKILTMILASILTFTLAPYLANAKPVEQEQLNVTEVHSVSESISLTEDSSQRQARAAQVGKLDIWISNSPKRINWKITMFPPYNGKSFTGTFAIANLKSGATQRVGVKGMSGYISQPMLKSTYRASLSGKVSPVGYALGSQSLIWNN
jgi:hypothetical protein